jgi:enhancer of polycomb-like protein
MIEHKKGIKEIPIPGVTRIPTYALEYLPTFRDRNTYLRGRGGCGYDDPTFVEYDLDSEDESWLAEFNRDQERLTADKFEAMLWKLDVGNADATDKVFAFHGQTSAERNTAEACGTTDHFQRSDALQLLEEMCPARDTIRAAVYDFWLRKRARLGHPLLRRLQAPTPHTNPDPYRVFRPRERIGRPQTRRRRENNPDSLDKLNLIGENIRTAMSLFELVVRRERKKRDMAYVATDLQQLQIKQRFEPRSTQEAIEQEYLAAAKNKGVKRPVGFEQLPEAAPVTTNALLDFRKKNKRRKKLGFEPQLNAVAQMGPPPAPPQPELLVTSGGLFIHKSIEEGSLNIPTGGMGLMSRRQWVTRIGRGGRLIFDRCKPFTWEPLENGNAEDIKPLYELPNPYAVWARGELTAATASGPSAPTTTIKLRLTPTPAAAGVETSIAPLADDQRSGSVPAAGTRTSSRQKS